MLTAISRCIKQQRHRSINVVVKLWSYENLLSILCRYEALIKFGGIFASNPWYEKNSPTDRIAHVEKVL